MFNVRFIPTNKSLDIFESENGIEKNKITLNILDLDPFQYKNFMDMVVTSMQVNSIEYTLPENSRDTLRIKSLLQVMLKDNEVNNE